MLGDRLFCRKNILLLATFFAFILSLSFLAQAVNLGEGYNITVEEPKDTNGLGLFKIGTPLNGNVNITFDYPIPLSPGEANLTALVLPVGYKPLDRTNYDCSPVRTAEHRRACGSSWVSNSVFTAFGKCQEKILNIVCSNGKINIIDRNIQSGTISLGDIIKRGDINGQAIVSGSPPMYDFREIFFDYHLNVSFNNVSERGINFRYTYERDIENTTMEDVIKVGCDNFPRDYNLLTNLPAGCVTPRLVQNYWKIISRKDVKFYEGRPDNYCSGPADFGIIAGKGVTTHDCSGTNKVVRAGEMIIPNWTSMGLPNRPNGGIYVNLSSSLYSLENDTSFHFSTVVETGRELNLEFAVKVHYGVSVYVDGDLRKGFRVGCPDDKTCERGFYSTPTAKLNIPPGVHKIDIYLFCKDRCFLEMLSLDQGTEVFFEEYFKKIGRPGDSELGKNFKEANSVQAVTASSTEGLKDLVRKEPVYFETGLYKNLNSDDEKIQLSMRLACGNQIYQPCRDFGKWGACTTDKNGWIKNRILHENYAEYELEKDEKGDYTIAKFTIEPFDHHSLDHTAGQNARNAYGGEYIGGIYKCKMNWPNYETECPDSKDQYSFSGFKCCYQKFSEGDVSWSGISKDENGRQVGTINIKDFKESAQTAAESVIYIVNYLPYAGYTWNLSALYMDFSMFDYRPKLCAYVKEKDANYKSHKITFSNKGTCNKETLSGDCCYCDPNSGCTLNCKNDEVFDELGNVIINEGSLKGSSFTLPFHTMGSDWHLEDIKVTASLTEYYDEYDKDILMSAANTSATRWKANAELKPESGKVLQKDNYTISVNLYHDFGFNVSNVPGTYNVIFSLNFINESAKSYSDGSQSDWKMYINQYTRDDYPSSVRSLYLSPYKPQEIDVKKISFSGLSGIIHDKTISFSDGEINCKIDDRPDCNLVTGTECIPSGCKCPEGYGPYLVMTELRINSCYCEEGEDSIPYCGGVSVDECPEQCHCPSGCVAQIVDNKCECETRDDTRPVIVFNVQPSGNVEFRREVKFEFTVTEDKSAIMEVGLFVNLENEENISPVDGVKCDPGLDKYPKETTCSYTNSGYSTGAYTYYASAESAGGKSTTDEKTFTVIEAQDSPESQTACDSSTSKDNCKPGSCSCGALGTPFWNEKRGCLCTRADDVCTRDIDCLESRNGGTTKYKYCDTELNMCYDPVWNFNNTGVIGHVNFTATECTIPGAETRYYYDFKKYEGTYANFGPCKSDGTCPDGGTCVYGDDVQGLCITPRGACSLGLQVCGPEYKWIYAQSEDEPVYRKTEICNGIDDNCNGWIDDTVSFNDIFRISLELAINHGITRTARQITQCQCFNGLPPGKEVCDSIDNDCDGIIDNSVKYVLINNCTEKVIEAINLGYSPSGYSLYDFAYNAYYDAGRCIIENKSISYTQNLTVNPCTKKVYECMREGNYHLSLIHISEPTRPY